MFQFLKLDLKHPARIQIPALLGFMNAFSGLEMHPTFWIFVTAQFRHLIYMVNKESKWYLELRFFIIKLYNSVFAKQITQLYNLPTSFSELEQMNLVSLNKALILLSECGDTPSIQACGHLCSQYFAKVSIPSELLPSALAVTIRHGTEQQYTQVYNLYLSLPSTGTEIHKVVMKGLWNTTSRTLLCKSMKLLITHAASTEEVISHIGALFYSNPTARKLAWQSILSVFQHEIAAVHPNFVPLMEPLPDPCLSQVNLKHASFQHMFFAALYAFRKYCTSVQVEWDLLQNQRFLMAFLQDTYCERLLAQIEKNIHWCNTLQ